MIVSGRNITAPHHIGGVCCKNSESSTQEEVQCWDSEKQIHLLQQYFIGPQAQNSEKALNMIKEIVGESFEWRRGIAKRVDKQCEKISIPKTVPYQKEIDELNNKMESKVRFVIEKMKDEIPSFSTNFLCQMLNDNTLPSIYGNIISLMQNPNVCTHQLSRVARHFEDEGIVDISEMLGFRKGSSFGHFTADGTLANFESVVRARARCYDWIAMGCMAKKYDLPLSEKEKAFCSSVFNIGHMGWELYDKISNLFEEYISQQEGITKYELLQPYMLEFDLIQAAFNITQLFEKKEFFQSPIMIVPNNKHYSWPKSHVFGIDFNQFWYVDIDENGRMSTEHLRELVMKAKQVDRPIFMLVSVFGSTECGNFDRLDQIIELIQEFKRSEGLDIYLHCDGAYGGFMLSTLRDCEDSNVSDYESYMNYANCLLGPDLIKSLLAIKHANSITIDPHKLAYAPYACGAYIQREEREYYYRKCDAPYIAFQGRERGTVSLEGSRAVGGVLGTWLTSKVIGFNYRGLGSIVMHSIKSKQCFVERVEKIPNIYVLHGDTNIVCFIIAKKGESLLTTNKRTTKLFQYFAPDNFDAEFYASMTTFKASSMVESAVNKWQGEFDTSCADGSCLKVLRMVFMNPFFNTPASGCSHMDRLLSILQNMATKESNN